MFFKKKKIEIKSPMNGKVINITEVKDEAFSSKALGDGVAIIPDDGKVYSPADATVISVIPTKHAVGLETKDGAEILIHVGQDTIKLQGKYFNSTVNQDDTVKLLDTLIEFEKENIEKEGYDTTTPIVIANTDDFKSIEIAKVGQVKAGDIIMLLEK